MLNYCPDCGTKLCSTNIVNEGEVPYCSKCQKPVFPRFNCAISAICYDPQREKILLIQQYGRKDNILVAGYLKKGESSEEALLREVKEETGLTVQSFSYNTSQYFPKSDTLMLSYACTLNGNNLSNHNWEIDDCAWFTPEEALKAIKQPSLAQIFLTTWLKKRI